LQDHSRNEVFPMNHQNEQISPWRQRAYVTVAEAAAILGRSQSWIRDQITARAIEPIRFPGGPTVIPVSTIVGLIEAAETASKAARVRELEPPRPRRRIGQTHLRLVINNDL
jgi:hypothetical protein